MALTTQFIHGTSVQSEEREVELLTWTLSILALFTRGVRGLKTALCAAEIYKLGSVVDTEVVDRGRWKRED